MVVNSLEISLGTGDENVVFPEDLQQRSSDPARSDRTIANVRSATLTISWPSVAGPMPAVVICPGGGYGMLVIDKEGHDLARWLNAHGYVAAVLKYRLPRPPVLNEILPWPVEDAKRAMRLLRRRAGEWNICRDAVGIMGSSAGGHLAAAVSAHSDTGDSSAGDVVERESSRPDFQILLYPVISFLDSEWAHSGSRRNLLGTEPDDASKIFFSLERQVRPGTPPAFVVHAIDDGIVHVEHSRRYCAAFQSAQVPCEYVELTEGGHGFGLGVNGGEPLRWPPLCLEWLKGLHP